MKPEHAKSSGSLVRFAVIVGLLVMPTILAAQERIAFTSNRDDNFEIYAMNADGTNQKRLTNNAAGDVEPAFSPDGSKIAFTSNRDGNSEIYVMNADGTNQKRLTNNAASDNSPAWSPDGKKIVFSSFRDGDGEIYLMNSDGTNQVNLTNHAGNDTVPAFSPDGRKIAFRSLRAGAIEVYVMNADGSNQTALTDSPAIDTEPAFSPDGTTIVFRTHRDALGNREIYLMNADGTDQKNISNNPAEESKPAFSTDGNKIVFTSNRDGNNEIYVMKADGANPVNLSNNPTDDFSPSWGPANTAPVLEELKVTTPADEGALITLTGKIKDPDENDSFTIRVDWGQGLGTQVEVPATSRSFEITTKPYTDDKPDGTASDEYTITVTIDDHRFGTGTGSLPITVNNVPPSIDVVLEPSSVVLGSPVTLTHTVTDPAQIWFAHDEGLQVHLDWGDGQNDLVVPIGPGPIISTHKYANVGTYTITVRATDDDLGETIERINAVVSPPPPPSAPANLRVDLVGMSRIQLAWTDTSNNEGGFAIERCSNRGCNNFVEIDRVGANTNLYLDTTLFANTQYYYRIRAFNVGGMSAYSDVVSAKTLRK